GVAVGANGTFLRTTTGGTTWSVQHAPSGDDLRRIWFVNEEVGVAVADARIFRTTDGGQTWVGQTHPGVSALSDVSGRGGHALVAVTGEGAILRSPDAGETWSQLNEGTRADFRSVARAGSQAFV